MSNDNNGQNGSNPLFSDLLDQLTKDVSVFSKNLSQKISNATSKNSDDKKINHEDYNEGLDDDASDIQKQDRLKQIQRKAENMQNSLLKSKDSFEEKYQQLKEELKNNRKNDGKYSPDNLPEIKDISSLLKKYKEKFNTIADNLDNVDTNTQENIDKASAKEVFVDDTATIAKENQQDNNPIQKSSVMPDDQIFGRLLSLLDSMSGKNNSFDESWEGFEEITINIRSELAKLILDKKNSANEISKYLKEFNEIILDIQKDCNNWEDAKKQKWSSWCSERLSENEKLSVWIKPDVSHDDITNSGDDLSFVVPSNFKGKGIYPRAPSSVPVNLVSNLSKVADFFEFASMPKSLIAWRNTPAKASFDKFQSQLEDWSPMTDDERIWKEKALDRYSVINARITLKCSDEYHSKNDVRSTRKPSNKKRL